MGQLNIVSFLRASLSTFYILQSPFCIQNTLGKPSSNIFSAARLEIVFVMTAPLLESSGDACSGRQLESRSAVLDGARESVTILGLTLSS